MPNASNETASEHIALEGIDVRLENFEGNRIRRMARVQDARRYDVPVERGFAFITDTANWSKFWPGYVRLEQGSSWGANGDTARLVTRLFGRERELTMTIRTFEANRLVTYTSTQPGLPDAYHERHFEREGHGFVYRLVVVYEPRGGIAGVFDRVLLMRGIRRAFERTFVALERELVRAQ
jgi:Polyketide cyclase / dehydrase and lipid transport